MRCRRKNKYLLFGIICLLVVIAIIVFFYFNRNIKIILNGKENIIIDVNSNYEELGANLLINNKKKNNLLHINGLVNTKLLGEYEITYSYLNKKIIRKVEVIDKEVPKINLKGNSEILIYTGQQYQDEGYIVTDNYDKDISSKVKVTNNINYNASGIYYITYVVEDSSKNKNTIKRKIIVKEKTTKFSKYNNIDNKNTGWSIWNNNGTRPTNKDINYFKKYNAYFLGKDEKVLYLTFDEGGNLVTYVEPIVDILNKYNVKSTFFMCDNYIKNNPALINKIVSSGHIIGNHTVNHYSMFSMVNDYNGYMYQINKVEETYKSITGKAMPKLFRYPNGEYSNRTLSIMKDLGYKTIFWSISYDDWQKNTSKEYAYNILTSKRHNGAIYLIHPKNKGNYEALEDFIKDSISKGYRFDLVTNI